MKSLPPSLQNNRLSTGFISHCQHDGSRGVFAVTLILSRSLSVALAVGLT